MVAELTAPEQDRFARLRLEKVRAEHNVSAELARWLVATLARLLPYSFAVGYRNGKATHEDGRYIPIPKPQRLEWLMQHVPGLDQRKQPKRKRRR